MTNYYDEKIMNFDVSCGYEAFMKLFDEAEVSEMYSWLEREFDYCYDFLDVPYSDGTYKTEQEKREYIVVDYIKEWLCQNIRNSITDGTEQLFNIVYAVL